MPSSPDHAPATPRHGATDTRPPVRAVLFDLDTTLIGPRALLLRWLVSAAQTRFDARETAVGPAAHALHAFANRAQRLTTRAARTQRVLRALRQADLPVGLVTEMAPARHRTPAALRLEEEARCVVVGRHKPDDTLLDSLQNKIPSYAARGNMAWRWSAKRWSARRVTRPAMDMKMPS